MRDSEKKEFLCGVDSLGDEASMLTAQEDEIFESMVRQFPDIFKGKLSRDGVPRPDVYWSEPIRVLFVFREANSKYKPSDWDLRAQVRTCWFQNRFGKPSRTKGWWNCRVAGFGHAVVRALAGGSPSSYEQFKPLIAPGPTGFRTHPFLFPFAFIQIKKVGGGGKRDTEGIVRHADLYREFLKRQVEAYKPHLIIGCGRGSASPARLLKEYLLSGGEARRTVCPRLQQTKGVKGFKWWRFSDAHRPIAMLEFYHPSAQGVPPEQLYAALTSAVREIALDLPDRKQRRRIA
jgi:hypothetical protein